MLRIVFQLIVFMGVSFSARSQTFYTLYSAANLTYRDLSPNGNGVGGSLEAFFRSRREAENPVIREKIGFGIGTFIGSNMQFQTGIFYKRFGDMEKKVLPTIVPGMTGYEFREYRIKHSYYYVGVPLILDYYLMDVNELNFGLRLAPEVNYLVGSKHKAKNSENVFGDSNGYPTYITETYNVTFGIETGILCSKEINSTTSINFNVLFNYHLTRDFERETTVNQNNYALGVNLMILKKL